MFGQKMEGLWELVRTSRGEQRQEQWLISKKRDAFARPYAEYDVVAALPDSILAKPPNEAGQGAGVPGAVKSPLLDTLVPQLATLAVDVPTSGDWLYEIKFDGYRMLARIDEGEARLLTRNGHDWTAKMPALIKVLEQLDLKSGWLDGEVVVLDEAGLPRFNALQKPFETGTGGTLS